MKFKLTRHSINQFRTRIQYDAKAKDILKLLLPPLNAVRVDESTLKIKTTKATFVIKDNVVITVY